MTLVKLQSALSGTTPKILSLVTIGLVVGAFSYYGLSSHPASHALEPDATVTVEGTVVKLMQDDFTHHTHSHQLLLRTADNKSYRLNNVMLADDTAMDMASSAEPTYNGGEHVRVTGQLSTATNALSVTASTVLAASAPVDYASQTAAMDADQTSTPKPTRLAVVIVIVRGMPPAQDGVPTVAELKKYYFTNPDSTVTFFKQNSYNKVQITGDVFGPITIDKVSDDCVNDVNMYDAEVNASNLGTKLASYDHVQYIYPSCGTYKEGVGEVPGRNSWMFNLNREFNEIGNHELGHNYGIMHANFLACQGSNGTPVSLSADVNSCSNIEYGNPFSDMGGQYVGLFDVSMKARAGWLSPGQVVTPRTSGLYTVVPLESQAPGGLRALRIQRTYSDSFYVDLRQPTGFDDFSRFGSGIIDSDGLEITVSQDYAPNPVVPVVGLYSQLIDTTPNVSKSVGYNDAEFHALLKAGKSLKDPASGVVITAIGKDASGNMQVRITLPADTIPPTVPTLNPATVTASSVGLSWPASTDSRNDVAGYRIYKNKTLLKTVTGTSFSDTAVSNATVTKNSYNVTAVDSLGNESIQSATVATGDNTPPSAPTNFRITKKTASSVTFAWDASTDNVAVAGYTLKQIPNILYTGTATTFTYKTDTSKFTTDGIILSAFDAQGNTTSVFMK